MDDIFNYEDASKIVEQYRDYQKGKYLFDKVNKFSIAENSDMVFPKNFSKATDKSIEIYLFKTNKIYKIFFDENNDEVVNFKIIKKNDINFVEFSVDYDDDYTVLFQINNEKIKLASTDVSGTYSLKTNNTLRKIIEYLNN